MLGTEWTYSVGESHCIWKMSNVGMGNTGYGVDGIRDSGQEAIFLFETRGMLTKRNTG